MLLHHLLISGSPNTDERYAFITAYSAEYFRDINRAFFEPVREFGPPKSQAFVCDQGTPAEYADSPGQSADVAE
jgi:hypothetical protein